MKSNYSSVENSAIFTRTRKHRWESAQNVPSGVAASRRYNAAVANIAGLIDEARNPEMHVKKVILARSAGKNKFRIIGHNTLVEGFDAVKSFARGIKYSHVRFLSNVIPA